jgi:proteic killer suppression protein
MIKSFKHGGLEKFFLTGGKRGINPEHCKKLAIVLDLLDAASNAADMNFPGAGLHKLEPRQENRWSVKVSGNWRITFKFTERDASEVDYIDYH